MISRGEYRCESARYGVLPLYVRTCVLPVCEAICAKVIGRVLGVMLRLEDASASRGQKTVSARGYVDLR